MASPLLPPLGLPAGHTWLLPSVGTNMGQKGSDAVASSKTGTWGMFWCGPEMTLSPLSTTVRASSQDLSYLEAQLALNSLADPGLLTLALVPVSQS